MKIIILVTISNWQYTTNCTYISFHFLEMLRNSSCLHDDEIFFEFTTVIGIYLIILFMILEQFVYHYLWAISFSFFVLFFGGRFFFFVDLSQKWVREYVTGHWLFDLPKGAFPATPWSRQSSLFLHWNIHSWYFIIFTYHSAFIIYSANVFSILWVRL